MYNPQQRVNKTFLLGTTGQLRSPGLDGASSFLQDHHGGGKLCNNANK